MRALVSASDVLGVLDTHVDRVHDAARRLGCSEGEAYEVTQTAAGELIGDLAERPQTVGDLVGGLYARAREIAVRVRRGGGAPVPLDDDATSSLLGDSEEVRAVEDALFDLPERRRLGVLLIDSYALTLPQAAVALGLDAAETARTVALGRLALVEIVDGRAAPSLSGHDSAVGDLGMLADGTAPAGGRFAGLRRHVSGCATCAGVLGVETRGRGLVAALPVLGLGVEDREQLFAAIGPQAISALASAEQIAAELAGDVERPPLIPWYVIALAVALALLLGVGVGALARGSGSPDISSAVEAPDSTTTSVSTTPTTSSLSPSPSATTTSPSPSSSAPVTPSSSRSVTPTTTSPTRTASPSPSKTVAPVAKIVLTPNHGPSSTTQTVTVTGSGFPPAALVTVTYRMLNGQNGFTGSTTTNASGAFRTTLSPNDPQTVLGGSTVGPHLVTATANATTATAVYDQTAS